MDQAEAEFSRRQRVNPEGVDLRQRIESIRDVLNSGIGGGVALTVDVPMNAWPVVVDTAEFEIALVNLVMNSRDAMPEGGTIVIGAENMTVVEEGGAVAPGEYVAVSVKDTGVGITPDVLAKVFEPFFTTKPVGKGTGLGLSQVYGFTHQAGGTVRVSSELGQGTSIAMVLPRAPLDAAAAGPGQTAAGPAQSGTVLLVEDNPDVASASTGLLEQLGYSVRWVADAESALKEIEKDGIDFVFSDIVMPGRIDGLGLARAIKQKHPGLPILLATGYSEAAQTAREDFPILRKPYQMHELSKAIADLTRG
jgi:CheY-like chemotaxis protein